MEGGGCPGLPNAPLLQGRLRGGGGIEGSPMSHGDFKKSCDGFVISALIHQFPPWIILILELLSV